MIDELADMGLVMDRPERAEFENQVLRFAQRARAVGIFLVLATERPTVEFVTGALNANLHARISFRLPQRVDSQVILDEPGAEDLLGAGDLLLSHGERMERVQAYCAAMDDAARMVEEPSIPAEADLDVEAARPNPMCMVGMANQAAKDA